MACNVFGTPVTDATLKGMTEYHDKPIEAVDRARVALEMKNAEGKDTAARDFVDKLQTNDPNVRGVRSLIYNATGSPLKLVAAFEYFDAEVLESPHPTLIQNGQWGSFASSNQLREIVVYEATQYPARQWVLAWERDSDHLSRCYAEIRPKGTYSENADSNQSQRRDLIENIHASNYIHEAEDNGDIIISTIGLSDRCVYEAILTRTAALE